MDNASQALIIAGGVLIALVLISLGVYVFGGLHDVAKMQDQKTETEQLVEFNKKYEAYRKSLMYGTDVITVMNMAHDDNATYGYNIQVTFNLIDKNIYAYNSDLGQREGNGNFSATGNNYEYYEQNIKYVKGDPVLELNKDRFDDFKRRLFSGTIHYDENTGRVDSMTFTEQTMTDKQYEHK